MSTHNISQQLEGLVFYADEEGDDFTFYLARDEENSVLNRLERSRAKERLRLGLPDKGFLDRGFSFAEKVTIRRLGKVSDSFWKSLRHAAPASRYAYLLSKLKKRAREKSRSVVAEEQKKGEIAHAILEKFETGAALLKADKDKLRPLLALTLNKCIHEDNLWEKSWATGLVPGMPKRRRTKRDAATDAAHQRGKWNLVIIESAFPALEREPQQGRALICLSNSGKYLSVTFRKLSKSSGYAASFFPADKEAEERRKNLFSLGEYCKLLYQQLFEETESTQHARGLLVITGSTNSAKSEIARGLIHLYLSRDRDTRRRHLVTFEDPIEKLYADDAVAGHPWVAVEMSAQAYGSDYSPRERAKDVGLLKQGLADALRQSPAVVFVGETREKEEWEALLDFAATGHLLVTTAHAGSLLEATHKIFEALEVKTPEDRSEVANKLLGVVHLRKASLAYKRSGTETLNTNALLPALWRRTGRGVAALTSDGLASLLPYRPKKTELPHMSVKPGARKPGSKTKTTAPNNSQGSEADRDKDPSSCLGRRWFIERLMEDEEIRKGLVSAFKSRLDKPFGPDKQESIKMQAYKKATDWDLQGV